MTAAASIVTGARIIAAAVRNTYPQAAVKAFDQASATTTSPLAPDLELHLAVTASTAYLFCCYLDYETSNMQYNWSVPSGSTMRYALIGASGSNSTQKESTTYVIGATGPGTLDAATMIGTLVTGTAAGTLQLTFTTNVGGLAVTIHAQSFLALWQLSP